MKSNGHILLVDDDTLDRELFIEALSKTAFKYQVSEAGDGGEALQLLDENKVSPSIIVLDLNMPIKDGRETLKELKSNKAYQNIPVFILSTSNAEKDVASAYEWGASLFLTKPHRFDDLIELVKCLLTLSLKYSSFVY